MWSSFTIRIKDIASHESMLAILDSKESLRALPRWLRGLPDDQAGLHFVLPTGLARVGDQRIERLKGQPADIRSRDPHRGKSGLRELRKGNIVETDDRELRRHRNLPVVGA